MVSLIAQYVSLVMLLIAMGYAISLVKHTKFNVSWILISCGMLVLVITQLLALSTVYMSNPELEAKLSIAVRWLNSFTGIVFMLGIYYVRRLIKHLNRMEQFRAKMENRVLSAVIKTEERERQHFAKELHDGIGPSLSVIKMLISSHSVEKSGEENSLIDKSAIQATDEAITCIREISAKISPHILTNFGLDAAIDAFVKRMKPTINVGFKSNIKGVRFPYAVEVIIYRVVCELINNTLKHAEATEIKIKLIREGHFLNLNYEDNGKGFDIEGDSVGMGLDNMRYRLRSGNGDLEISSAPGKGMKAVAKINCNLF